VVAYQNGERITIDAARKIVEKWKEDFVWDFQILIN
jgi:hypothetical protein